MLWIIALLFLVIGLANDITWATIVGTIGFIVLFIILTIEVCWWYYKTLKDI